MRKTTFIVPQLLRGTTKVQIFYKQTTINTKQTYAYRHKKPCIIGLYAGFLSVC